MRAITSATLADLEAVQQKLDAALGYPIYGVDIGGGVHAPPEQSRTLRRADIIAHPKLAQWALPVDGVDAKLLTAQKLVTVLVADADWKPVAVKEPVAT